MPRGDKSKYTGKQDRKAEHIEESHESRGVPEKEAERRAWATVNKDDGGGKRAGGSGRGKSTGHPAAHKGGLERRGRLSRATRGKPIRRGRKKPPRHASATPLTRHIEPRGRRRDKGPSNRLLFCSGSDGACPSIPIKSV